MFQAKNREEKEICNYDFDPPELRLIPGQSTEVELTVKPFDRFKRPFRVPHLTIDFHVELLDTEDRPLKRQEQIQEAQLLWKRRPWWHLLLLILFILASIAGLYGLIWYLFLRPSPIPKIVDFGPHQTSYTEGDFVRLNFEVTWNRRDVEKLEEVEVIGNVAPLEGTSEPPRAPEPIVIYQRSTDAELPEGCEFFSAEELRCTSLATSATAAGQYTFDLNVTYKKDRPPETDDTTIAIKLKDFPEIGEFSASPAEFVEGENTWLSWTIGSLENTDQILLLKVIATNQSGVKTELPIYGAGSEEIGNLDLSQCQQEFRVLTCQDIPLDRLDANVYNLELSGTVRGRQEASVELVGKSTIIEVKDPPIEITSFTVNGQQIHPPTNPPLTALCVPSGSTADVAWSVRGKDVKVDVGELRNYGPQYETQIILPTTEFLPQQSKLQLKAKNNDGFAVESNYSPLRSIPTTANHPRREKKGSPVFPCQIICPPPVVPNSII
jgi:hypothetical protein